MEEFYFPSHQHTICFSLQTNVKENYYCWLSTSELLDFCYVGKKKKEKKEIKIKSFKRNSWLNRRSSESKHVASNGDARRLKINMLR